MIYKEALDQLIQSNVIIGNQYMIGSHGDENVFLFYKIGDITISTINELNAIKNDNSKYSNEDALKNMGLIEQNNLEVMLTFYCDSMIPILMTLTKYLDYLKYSTC